MNVDELMTRDVIAAREGTPLKEVARMLGVGGVSGRLFTGPR